MANDMVVLEQNPKILAQYEHIAKQFECDVRDVIAMKNVSCPDLDIQNFTVFMNIAKTYDLDPQIKEIYGFSSKGRVLIMVSNSGFLKIARKQNGYKSIVANAVYPSDEFEMDMSTGKIIKHIIHPELNKVEDVPHGAYAILNMEGKEPVTKWVYWNEYVQSGDYTPWRKQKSAMICKCATSILCREAFGLSGLYGEEEMSVDDKNSKKEKIRAKSEEETDFTVESLLPPEPITNPTATDDNNA